MDDEYRRKLVKNIQMLATLVATATYAAAFNPPGGVWQDIHDATGRHLPGDPIMQSTHHVRYVVFFYCNAAAFAFSLAVVVLTLLVTAHPNNKEKGLHRKGGGLMFLMVLMSLMLVAMLALAVAYGAGACQDKLMVVLYCLLVPGPLASFISKIVVLGLEEEEEEEEEEKEEVAAAARKEGDEEKDFRKLVVPLSMFALTITYVAGLSTPGGFWDSAEGGHRPGDAILKDRLHGKTLRGFLLTNTLAFAASLYGVSIVIVRNNNSMASSAVRSMARRANIIIVVLGLLGGILAAYISGSSRGRSGITWLSEAALAYIALHVVVHVILVNAMQGTCFWKAVAEKVSEMMEELGSADISADQKARKRRQAKLVQLMAGLAVAITYQAGLYPPGGLWPANADGHMAGDPILLTTNARRYKGFHYCNSVSFVASLLVMFLNLVKESLSKKKGDDHGKEKAFNDHHALEAAMLLDMLGLIGAYAIASCRDQVSTLYVVGLAGAAVVYVVVHVSYFTLGDPEDDRGGANKKIDASVEKMGGRFLLFAILVASITYQAGLTPPGGFLLKDDYQSGHRAGDPVLRYNYPRRYRTFIYCNSVSFMLSVVLILLLVNPNEYGPAIRSHALSVCSAVSYVCLMGAFAAGSTQHMKGSIYIFVVAAVAFFFCIVMPLWIYLRWQKQPPSDSSDGSNNSNIGGGGALASPASGSSISVGTNKGPPALGDRREGEDIEKMGAGEEKKKEEETRKATSEKEEEKKGETSKSVYLVTLAILVASATYPAGLDPPGGSWQSSSDGHDAGNPMMHDNRRQRYFAFFFSNTTSFMASIMLIHMLLPAMLRQTKELHESYRKGLNGLASLQCLGFLVAYAAGSSRQWKTSVYTGALVIPVVIFVAIHVRLSIWRQNKKTRGGNGEQNAPH